MRWIVFIPIAYLTLVVQTSLGSVLRVPVDWLGVDLCVDLLAVLTVATALRVRGAPDALLAGWTLGLLHDLTQINSPVGLFAITFALAAGAVHHVRDAIFRDNPFSQLIVALAFTLGAHAMAVLFINLYVRSAGGMLGRELGQALVLAVCTAAVTPLLMPALRPLDRLIMVQPAGRR